MSYSAFNKNIGEVLDALIKKPDTPPLEPSHNLTIIIKKPDSFSDSKKTGELPLENDFKKRVEKVLDSLIIGVIDDSKDNIVIKDFSNGVLDEIIGLNLDEKGEKIVIRKKI
jgi:hypothetical protein